MPLEKPPKFTPKQSYLLKSFVHVTERSEVTPHDWSAPFIAWFLGWNKMENEWPEGTPTASKANEAMDFLYNLTVDNERVTDAPR